MKLVLFVQFLFITGVSFLYSLKIGHNIFYFLFLVIVLVFLDMKKVTVLPLSIYRLFENTDHFFEKNCALVRG